MAGTTSLAQIRVVVADDHPVVLRGLEALIGDHTSTAVVGTATNGDEAVSLVLRERPDVAILDLRMPGTDGLEATRRILAAFPSARIIILSATADPASVREIFGAGATGFVPKHSLGGFLLDAIELVMEGKAVMPPEIARMLALHSEDNDPAGLLSPREMEIVRLIAEGKTNEQIATALGRSLSTVKGQLTALFDKLGAVDRASALAICFRNGWLS